MTKCCTIPDNQAEIGTHGHCEILRLPIKAAFTGKYTAKWMYKGAIISKEFVVSDGDYIEIDNNWFNENSTNIITFYDPDGEQLGISEPDPITTICRTINEFVLKIVPKFKVQDKAIEIEKLICSTGKCMANELIPC